MQRKMQIKMNKKGDISIVILVIGIIAICFLAILSFVKLNKNINDNFLGIGLIETMNSVEEEFNLYDDKSEFSGDYGNVFEREGFFGKVKININDENVRGVYIAKETGFLNLFYPEERTIINITYDK
jgi:hypothetical protein